jgi:hypothetical protein
MKVGSATVFVETVGPPASIAPTRDFQAVGLDPREAFEKASDALTECVRVVGDKIEQVGAAIQPEEVGVEFTLTFAAEGKAHIVPVLVSGKATSTMGIKVHAIWKPGENGGGTQ